MNKIGKKGLLLIYGARFKIIVDRANPQWIGKSPPSCIRKFVIEMTGPDCFYREETFPKPFSN